MTGILLTIVVCLMLAGPASALSTGEKASSDTQSDYERARQVMVSRQIEARGVADTLVLNAMRTVERHLFVPEAQQPEAYGDFPLPIGEGQTISQPYIVAIMTELLKPHPGDRVLEIGTGSGYQAAVLAEIVDTVFTIEIVEPLCRHAEALLDSLGYSNILVRCGDGYRGWPEKAPFDGVIVTCAPDEIPKPLIEQLAEGGRMVIPVGENYQELVLLRKIGGEVKKTAVLPVRFVPMTGEAQEK